MRNPGPFAGLRTVDAEIQVITKQTRSLDHVGMLFTPPANWFSQPLDDARLQDLLQSFCRWLGLKPRQLSAAFSVSYNQSPGIYVEDDSGHHIFINEKYQRNPYQTVAILAHEFTHYLVQSRWQVDLDSLDNPEMFIDLASIYCGFGVLILNGLAAPRSEAINLGSLGPQEFAYQLGHYVAQSDHVDEDDLYAEVAPWSRQYFVPKLAKHRQPALHVRLAETAIRRRRVILAGSLLALFVVLGLCAFIVTNRPATASTTLIQKHEKTDLLYTQYVLCSQSVARQKQAWPNPDVFQRQTIESNQQRCISLKNLYNAAVEDYNQALNK